MFHYFVFYSKKKNYFTLDDLNKRKQTYEYDPIEIGNISSDITLAHLNKKHLKMSAKEVLTFTIYLPLMIGDLIPPDDEVWSFLLILIEIIDLLMSFEVGDCLISTLKNKIETHNRQYVALFNDHLKPKFHILTHYPTVIQNYGPVRKFWSFQFESKHKNFKLYSHAITSRRNICLSLAKKFQFDLAYFLLGNAKASSKYYLSKNNEIKCNLARLVSAKLKIKEQYLKFYDQIQYDGTKYKKDYYVVKFSNDYKIYVIINIVAYKQCILLFCQEIKKTLFCPHYLAFEIDPTILGEYFILSFKDLIGPPVNLIKTARGRSMIRIKEYNLSF